MQRDSVEFRKALGLAVIDEDNTASGVVRRAKMWKKAASPLRYRSLHRDRDPYPRASPKLTAAPCGDLDGSVK